MVRGGNVTEVDASADELNLLNNASAAVTNNKAVIYGNSGEISANSITIGGVAVTASAAEINILDNVTNVTNTNINQLAGVSSSIKTDFENRYTISDADNKFSLKEGSSSIVTVGNVTDGTLADGFSGIDIKTQIKTTSGIEGGSLTIDQVVMDGSYIGHTDMPLLMKMSDGKVTVDGTLDVSSIILNDVTTFDNNAAEGINKISNVTSTASELNILNGALIDTSELNSLNGITYNVKDKFNDKLDISTAASTYSVKAGSNSITTVGNLVNGSIGGSMIINTTGNITGNNITGQKLEVSGIVISGNKIGNSSTPNLISISDGNVNVSGTFNTSSLKNGTNFDWQCSRFK